ncbi:MAG TPA: type II toxin-antitoxin system VapB family antitoxin [bacterium]|nr:type II toxin-antitoxin system VapB family antitoxin [bacterium]
MRTTITLNDDLLKMAQARTRATTVTGAVNDALADWARRLRVDRIKAMAGKVRFEGDLGELRRLELKKAEKLNARRPR